MLPYTAVSNGKGSFWESYQISCGNTFRWSWLSLYQNHLCFWLIHQNLVLAHHHRLLLIHQTLFLLIHHNLFLLILPNQLESSVPLFSTFCSCWQILCQRFPPVLPLVRDQGCLNTAQRSCSSSKALIAHLSPSSQSKCCLSCSHHICPQLCCCCCCCYCCCYCCCCCPLETAFDGQPKIFPGHWGLFFVSLLGQEGCSPLFRPPFQSNFGCFSSAEAASEKTCDSSAPPSERGPVASQRCKVWSVQDRLTHTYLKHFFRRHSEQFLKLTRLAEQSPPSLHLGSVFLSGTRLVQWCMPKATMMTKFKDDLKNARQG